MNTINTITVSNLNTLVTNLSTPSTGVEYFTINPTNENGYIIINASYNNIINTISQGKLPIFKSQGNAGISYFLITTIPVSEGTYGLQLANYYYSFQANSPDENFFCLPVTDGGKDKNVL